MITEKNINTIEEEKVDSKKDSISNQVVKDFDLSSEISCGNWKCFVPSLSDNRWSFDHPKSGAQCLHTLLDLQHGAETCKNAMDTRALKRRKKRRIGIK